MSESQTNGWLYHGSTMSGHFSPVDYHYLFKTLSGLCINRKWQTIGYISDSLFKQVIIFAIFLFLQILDISLSTEECLVKIFSCSVGACLIALFMISLVVHELNFHTVLSVDTWHC